VTTIAELVRAQAGGLRPGLLFEDRSWTWAEVVKEAAERASLAGELLGEGPPHVGVLLDNVPEFHFWLCAAALAGAVVVGVNPTRRGEELARDVRHTRCQLLVTSDDYAPLLEGLDLGLAPERVLNVDRPAYAEALGAHRGARLEQVCSPEVSESSLYLLIFTSGTTGAPKACVCSQGRLARIGQIVAETYGLSQADVCYQAMPMFHSNALMAGWAPALAAGATSALRRRFSASAFLADVRRFGATYFNYVGKPLSYILATPERPDDADNPLVRVFGNEAAEADIERFARRFGCQVVDSYGSTEGGLSIQRVPGTPPGSLGKGPEGTVVLDPETGEEKAPARFDASGRLLNPEEAIGELANRLGSGGFEGYWDNDEAEAARLRQGIYWTGDLAYRDQDGFIYFAGRDHDWLRVDGENFAAAPVERILERHPDVVLACVYAVPDPDVGDQVMAALQLAPGAGLGPDELGAFLADQPDLGTKWAPRFVRLCPSLPTTPTNKVLKARLRAEHLDFPDVVWWRPGRQLSYQPLGEADRQRLRGQLGQPATARRP
jgi:fatty-acyl-CoA synthase